MYWFQVAVGIVKGIHQLVTTGCLYAAALPLLVLTQLTDGRAVCLLGFLMFSKTRPRYTFLPPSFLSLVVSLSLASGRRQGAWPVR